MFTKISRILNWIIWYSLYCITNNVEIRHKSKRIGKAIEKIRVKSLVKYGALVGDNSFIRFQSYIINPHFLSIGAGSKIGIGAKLFLYDYFTIGDNVEIGSELTVHTSEHNLTNPALPLCKQGATYKSVIIGSDVYIGSKVVLLTGSKIEDRVVVGAGAVVRGTLKSGYLYAGVPAKKIKRLL